MKQKLGVAGLDLEVLGSTGRPCCLLFVVFDMTFSHYTGDTVGFFFEPDRCKLQRRITLP